MAFRRLHHFLFHVLQGAVLRPIQPFLQFQFGIGIMLLVQTFFPGGLADVWMRPAQPPGFNGGRGHADRDFEWHPAPHRA